LAESFREDSNVGSSGCADKMTDTMYVVRNMSLLQKNAADSRKWRWKYLTLLNFVPRRLNVRTYASTIKKDSSEKVVAVKCSTLVSRASYLYKLQPGEHQT